MAEVPKLAEALPPFPGIVLQLLDRMHDEESSLDALVRLARNDPVITSNILSNANHIRRLRVQSDLADPFAAASLIGVNRLRGIVVAAGMNQFLEKGKGGAFLCHHSQAVAIVAQELAALCGVSTEMAYVAGILHDIGQLCFHILDEQAFKEAYEQSSVDGKLLEREVDVFGLDHCRIGALIAEYWNLPAEYIERQVRAFTPWPGAFTIWKGKRIKILKVHVEGGKLVIDELQMEGKKPTTFHDFLLGHKDFPYA